MPSGPQIGGVDVLGLLYLALIFGVIFLPMVLGRRGSSGDSDSDSDGGGGGGKGPWRPRPPSSPPRGGIPLDDAEPGRVRLRGHERLADLVPARARRPAPEPHRRRVRTPGGS